MSQNNHHGYVSVRRLARPRGVIVAGAIAMALVSANTGAVGATTTPPESTQDESAECDETTTVRFAAGNINAHSSLVIALEKGYFADECINAERTVMTSSPDIAQAIATGAIDAGPASSNSLLNIWTSGLPVTAVMSTARGGDRVSIAVTPDSGIETVADLEGRTVAAQVGSIGHQIVLAALDSVGLTIDDIELINTQTSDTPALIATGQVDAIGTYEPYGSAVVASGDAVTLVRGGELMGQAPNFLMFDDDFIAEHPDVVTSFVTAVFRGMQFLRDDPAGAAVVMAEFIESTPEEIEQQNSFYIWNPLIDEEARASVDLDGQFLIDTDELEAMPQLHLDDTFQNEVVDAHPELVDGL